MGHIGLTPQSVNQLGGYKVQGKTPAAAGAADQRRRALEQAGAFAHRAGDDAGAAGARRSPTRSRVPTDRHRRRAGLRRPGAGAPRPPRPVPRLHAAPRPPLRRPRRSASRTRSTLRRRCAARRLPDGQGELRHGRGAAADLDAPAASRRRAVGSAAPAARAERTASDRRRIHRRARAWRRPLPRPLGLVPDDGLPARRAT